MYLMHKRPLAVISVFFALGIVLGRLLPDSVGLFHVFAVTLIFISFTLIFALTLTLSHKWERGYEMSSHKWERGYEMSSHKWEREARSSARSSLMLAPLLHTFLFLSVISLGALLYLNSNIFPPNHVSYFLGKDKIKTEITGVIKDPSEVRGVYYGKVSSRYVLEVEDINGSEVAGLALIRIQTEKDYQYGDRLRVKGTIKRPIALTLTLSHKWERGYEMSSHKWERGYEMSSNKWEREKTSFSYKQYLENRNIFAVINASEKNVTLLAHDYKVNPVLKFAYFIREKIKNQFLEKMPLESGAFMRAILLGDRSELPKNIKESFRNSGTMHMLAISGLHVALLAAVFMYFFKLFRLRREIYYILTMLLLVFLALLTGANASVVRAAIMCIIFLTGRLLGRPVDVYNSLGVAAFIILAINPKDVFSVGFQLSFAAVLSIVYLSPILKRFVKKDFNFYVKKYLLDPFAVSVSATLGTFPFILYYFRMGTPIAVISNILIIPLMFVLMIGGMCFIGLGWIPYVGSFIAYFNNTLADSIFFLADFFAGVKFGHFGI
jgi:ComEC/Rec2-related protein